MPGVWIARVVSRLTRPDTFDRLVSPAIADLQAEAGQGWLQRLRHYAALAAVLICAVFRDLRMDVSMAFGGAAGRQIWTRACAWAVLAGCCNLVATYALTLRMLNRLDGPSDLEAAVLNGVVFRSIVPAMVAALVIGAYQLKRRAPSGLRTVIAASLVFIVATPIVGSIASALHEPANNALEAAYRAARPDLPAATVPSRLATVLSGMLQTAAFAWLGVALARYRGWRLAFNAITILTPLLYGTSAIPANAVSMAVLILLCRTIQRPFDRPYAAVAR